MRLSKLFLKKIRLNKLSDKICVIVCLKFLYNTQDMRAGNKFFENFEIILIAHVH